jgi:hypothetical protein
MYESETLARRQTSLLLFWVVKGRVCCATARVPIVGRHTSCPLHCIQTSPGIYRTDAGASQRSMYRVSGNKQTPIYPHMLRVCRAHHGQRAETKPTGTLDVERASLCTIETRLWGSAGDTFTEQIHGVWIKRLNHVQMGRERRPKCSWLPSCRHPGCWSAVERRGACMRLRLGTSCDMAGDP